MNNAVAKELLKSWEATTPKQNNTVGQNQVMSKIETIEELLKCYQDTKGLAEEDGTLTQEMDYLLMERCMAAIIRVLDEPSDTTEPCENCVEYQKLKGTERWLIHCPTCGRLLDR